MNNPIFPCLWFDGQAKAAAEFYCSVFPDARITADTPMVVTWEINGNRFMGLNGGPHFTFSEAVSFVVHCDDQKEVDYYWERLTTDGGSESQCAWLKDKFGLSWQIVPKRLIELMSDPDRTKAERVMQAMLKMTKIIIADLENAYVGE
jgi:predicted 3-demethylubiquinone-9 3-methyltransferase (glyoxalase superfamily)